MDKKERDAVEQIISQLKARGETELAAELQKDLDSKVTAAMDSGVNVHKYGGDKNTDKAHWEAEEKEEMPKEGKDKAEASLEVALASAQKLLKFEVTSTIYKTEDGLYAVRASEEDEMHEEEKHADDEQPEILDEACANILIEANKKRGLLTKITRVESGYIAETLAADEGIEEKMDEKEAALVPNPQDAVNPVDLPEEKACGEDVNDDMRTNKTFGVKYEEMKSEDDGIHDPKEDEAKASDMMEEEKHAEDEKEEEKMEPHMDQFLSKAAADKAVAELRKQKKFVKVLKAGADKYFVREMDPMEVKAYLATVKAEDAHKVDMVKDPAKEVNPTLLPEDKAGENDDASEPNKMAMAEVLNETEANAAKDALIMAGVTVKITRVQGGFTVVAAAEEEMPEEEHDADLVEQRGADEEEMVHDEKGVESAVAALHAAGKNARITKVLNGFVVKASEEGVEDKVAEIKEDAKDDSEKVIDALGASGEGMKDEVENKEPIAPATEVKEELKDFEKKEEEKKAAAEEEYTVAANEEDEKEVEEKACSPGPENGPVVYKAQVEATNAVRALAKKGIKATMVKTAKGFEVKAISDSAEKKIEELESEQNKKLMEQGGKENPELKTTPTYVPAYLVSAETFRDALTADDFVMLLQANADDKPFYNVIVQGMPVAQIHLNDQPKADQIKAMFEEQQYAETIVDAMIKHGVHNTLKNVNAKFFANEVIAGNVKEKVAAELKGSFDKKYAEAVATVRDDLADRIALVIAGANKNMFKDLTPHLAAQIFAEVEAKLVEGSLNKGSKEQIDMALAEAIQAAFNDKAAAQFGAYLDKAIAFLDMPKEALAELKKVVGESNIQPLDYVEASDEEEEEHAGEEEEKTYAQYLASKNVPTTGWMTQEEAEKAAKTKIDPTRW